jgi:hypothetical protein
MKNKSKKSRGDDMKKTIIILIIAALFFCENSSDETEQIDNTMISETGACGTIFYGLYPSTLTGSYCYDDYSESDCNIYYNDDYDNIIFLSTWYEGKTCIEAGFPINCGHEYARILDEC